MSIAPREASNPRSAVPLEERWSESTKPFVLLPITDENM
jgi:hypothetical protein